MIETEMPPRFAFIMFCIYLVFIWRWRTTAKIANQLQRLLVVGVLLPFALFIGAITGAWQTAGAAAAEAIIPGWAYITGTLLGAILAPWLLLFSLSTVGALLNLCYCIYSQMTTPAQKVKRTPQNLGDFDRLKIPDEHLETIPLRRTVNLEESAHLNGHYRIN